MIRKKEEHLEHVSETSTMIGIKYSEHINELAL